MEKYTSLLNTWFGTLHGRPVRVEEHWNNLSYIVEFYDASEENNGHCITHDPVTGKQLTTEMLQHVNNPVTA